VIPWRFYGDAGNQEEPAMPVVLLWGLPVLFVLGGVTYMIVK
jgi:hypothetical protein